MHGNLQDRYSAGVNQLSSIDVSGAAPAADLTHFFNLIPCPSHLLQLTSQWAGPYLIHHELETDTTLQVLAEEYHPWETCRNKTTSSHLPCRNCLEPVPWQTQLFFIWDCVTWNSNLFIRNYVVNLPQNINLAQQLVCVCLSKYLLTNQ